MGLRILLISHNPMNLTENNGRTLRNLLSGIGAERISHLFFHDGEIDAPFCSSFYRITDFDIKNSLFRFKKAGNVVELSKEQQIVNEDKSQKYAKYCEKPPFVRFLRDVAWGFGSWKSKRLKEWLKGENPNVIFFYGSDSVFCQKIANWIKNFLKVPMVIYWVDDFYLKLNKCKGFFTSINSKRYKRITKKNIFLSKNICITSQMSIAYEKEFKKKFDVIYNSSFVEPYKEKPIHNPIIMSYLGNIGLGRCDSLIQIGNIISKNNLPIDFSVYSGENREYLLEKINNAEGLTFKGKISYKEVLKVMEDSDILVHVESFSEENINFCRYSLSTKIADSLASKRCILCYGPNELASVKYLKDNKSALVASNVEDLTKVLNSFCSDNCLIREAAKNGFSLFEKNHQNSKNTETLKNIFVDCLN